MCTNTGKQQHITAIFSDQPKYLQVDDVFEDKRVTDGDLLPNPLIHGVDIGLVDTHAFLGQLGGVVDGDFMQLWVLAPVFIWWDYTSILLKILLIIFFCVPQLYLWGSLFWVRVLHMRPFFNPTIQVVTFRLHGW